MMKIRSRQKGVFAIELFFVLIALISIFYFMTDISDKLLARAQLDRGSFALANILKERSRYYDERLPLNASDEMDMQTLASRLLDTTPGSVAIKIEALHNKTTLNAFESNEYKNLGCEAAGLDTKSELAPVENGVIFSLYQVTLCQQENSWFTQLWGNSGASTMTITSSSVVVGR